MSKGVILSGGTGGQYSVSVQFDRDAIAARVVDLKTRQAALQISIVQAEQELDDAESEYNDRISEQNALIDAFTADPTSENFRAVNAKSKEAAAAAAEVGIKKSVLAALVAEDASITKELARLDAAPLSVTTGATCADFTEGLAGDVGLIEVPGGDRAQHLQIQPGYAGNAAYSAARDGMLRQPFADVPAATTYNLAMLPGWQKWLPRYRIAQITSIDTEEDTCSITIIAATSGEQSIDVNYATAYSDVPIDYMDCNASAFVVGDTVLVEFTGQTETGIEGNWAAGKLKVIGFASNPKPCDLCEASEVIPPLTEDASNASLVGITESDGFTDSHYSRREYLSNWGDRCYAIILPSAFDNYTVGLDRFIYDCETATVRTDLHTFNELDLGFYAYTGMVSPEQGSDYVLIEWCNGTVYNEECSGPTAPDLIRMLAKFPPIGSSDDLSIINTWTLANSSMFVTRASLRDTGSLSCAFCVKGATEDDDVHWSQATFYLDGQDPVRKTAGYYLEGRDADGEFLAEQVYYQANPAADMNTSVPGRKTAPEMGRLVQDSADGALISIQVDSFVAGLEEEELWYTLNLINPATGAILNSGSQPRFSILRGGAAYVDAFVPRCSLYNKNFYFGTRSGDGNLYISPKITSWYSGQSMRWSQNRVYSVSPASGWSSSAIVLPEQNRIVWRGDVDQAEPAHSRILQLADIP